MLRKLVVDEDGKTNCKTCISFTERTGYCTARGFYPEYTLRECTTHEEAEG